MDVSYNRLNSCSCLNKIINDNIFTYLNCSLNLKATINAVQRSGVRFDAIAFRGMSGALVAPAVTAHFRKPLIMSRLLGWVRA